MAKSLNGWAKAPLCVFCNKPWTDSMLEVEASTSWGCPTCGHGSETSGTVTIKCEHCERIVYQKDFCHDRY